jgi:hypothetical protein
MMLSLEDLSVKGTRQIVFDYPIHFSTQTLGTDGTHLLFGNYGARYEEGNVKGLNFSRATTDFRLLESRKFLASEGFFLVPPSIIRRETPVFMNVVSLGGNMQGWWRDPKGNPARIRFDYWAYDRQTGEMTNITDYSAGSGYPETIFIEEKKPLTISAAAWKKGASDCVSATYSVPEIYRDFRGYDRVAVDYVNDSGEAAGTPLQAFVSGKDGHVNRGLPAIGGEVPAKGYRRWIFSLENWDKAVAANPADVHRIHFYLYRPQAVNLRLYRITLLPKGAACPPPAEPFKKKILAPMGL